MIYDSVIRTRDNEEKDNSNESVKEENVSKKEDKPKKEVYETLTMSDFFDEFKI